MKSKKQFIKKSFVLSYFLNTTLLDIQHEDYIFFLKMPADKINLEGAFRRK